MALQLSGISVASGFALAGAKPLDVREILDTLSDRDELVTLGMCPEGFRIYVKETKKLYVYNGTSWNVVGGAEVFTGATTEQDGTSGSVPAPAKEDKDKFLRADGVWALPSVEGGVGSLTDLGVTASAAELNYMTGVTSSVQDQINTLSADKMSVDTAWGAESSPLPSFD